MWKLNSNFTNKTQHIIPIGEIHKEGEDCWCKPNVGILNEWKMFTHNSKDQREYLVEGKSKEVIN